MLSDKIQGLCGFLLLFSRLSQILRLLFAGFTFLSFLHRTVHLRGWFLNHGDTVIGVTRSFALRFFQHVLRIGVLNKGFGEIGNLLIDGILLLFQLRQLSCRLGRFGRC